MTWVSGRSRAPPHTRVSIPVPIHTPGEPMKRSRTAVAVVLLTFASANPVEAAEPKAPKNSTEGGCNRSIDPASLYIVNTQEYRFGDMEPVTTAYREVAKWCGWPQDKIDAWEPFIIGDVIPKESGGCWQVYGGTLYGALGQPCDQPSVRGKRSDAGFGQVTPVWYRGKKAPVCRHANLCSKQAVTSSPWSSMHSVIVAVDHGGSDPWCYSKRARRYHNCTLAPDR